MIGFGRVGSAAWHVLGKLTIQGTMHIKHGSYRDLTRLISLCPHLAPTLSRSRPLLVSGVRNRGRGPDLVDEAESHCKDVPVARVKIHPPY